MVAHPVPQWETGTETERLDSIGIRLYPNARQLHPFWRARPRSRSASQQEHVPAKVEVGPYLKPDFLFVAFSGKVNAVYFFHRLTVVQANSNNILISGNDFVTNILTSS